MKQQTYIKLAREVAGKAIGKHRLIIEAIKGNSK
jgi:hypothetical protein